jgi:hypothetical protein
MYYVVAIRHRIIMRRYLLAINVIISSKHVAGKTTATRKAQQQQCDIRNICKCTPRTIIMPYSGNLISAADPPFCVIAVVPRSSNSLKGTDAFIPSYSSCYSITNPVVLSPGATAVVIDMLHRMLLALDISAGSSSLILTQPLA